MSSLESTDTPPRDSSNALNPDMQTLMQMMKTMEVMLLMVVLGVAMHLMPQWRGWYNPHDPVTA